MAPRTYSPLGFTTLQAYQVLKEYFSIGRPVIAAYRQIVAANPKTRTSLARVAAITHELERMGRVASYRNEREGRSHYVRMDRHTEPRWRRGRPRLPIYRAVFQALAGGRTRQRADLVVRLQMPDRAVERVMAELVRMGLVIHTTKRRGSRRVHFYAKQN